MGAESENVEPTVSIEDLQSQIKTLTDELTTWKGHARTWEERSKANKEAADQLATIQADLDARSNELAEKVAEIESLNTSKLDLEAQLSRSAVALKFGLTAEDAALLTGDAESMEKLASRIAGPRAPKPDNHQGRGSEAAPTSTRDQFANLFNKN